MPHPTVAVIIEQDQRFLMVEERSNRRSVINQPAGHVENNESLVDAALREVLEETAWEVQITSLLGLYTYTAPHNGVTYHRTCFIAKPTRERPDHALDEGIERAIWLNYEDILAQADRLRSPMVTRCLDDYRAGKRYPLDLIVNLQERII
jgi:8-oxo-dGTP pyrophosphatase MutT (NUDIX family)